MHFRFANIIAMLVLFMLRCLLFSTLLSSFFMCLRLACYVVECIYVISVSIIIAVFICLADVHICVISVSIIITAFICHADYIVFYDDNEFEIQMQCAFSMVLSLT